MASLAPLKAQLARSLTHEMTQYNQIQLLAAAETKESAQREREKLKLSARSHRNWSSEFEFERAAAAAASYFGPNSLEGPNKAQCLRKFGRVSGAR